MITNVVSVSEPGTKQLSANHFGRNDSGQLDGSNQWDQLPEKILIKIFLKLGQNDLMRAATVCQSWRELINTTPQFWKTIHLKFMRNKNKKYYKKAYWYIKKRGMYFREFTVTCCHGNANMGCKRIIHSFRRLVHSLPIQLNLTKLKISDLRLQGVCNNMPLIRKNLTRMLSRQNRLECFQMSSAQWSVKEGNSVLKTVFTASRKTLRLLDIDGFFESNATDQGPDVFDELFTGIHSLSRLTKLGIDYTLLSDFFLTELSRSHAGQLTVLKINTKQVDGNTSIVSRSSWVILTSACPVMKVEFTVDGVCSLFKMVRILNPVIPVKKIRLRLQSGPDCPEVGSMTTAALLGHITMNFSHSLIKFELDIGKKSGFIDLAFLALVRKCHQLIYVKTPKQFSHPESERVVRGLIQQRRRKLNMRLPKDLVNKRVKTNPVDIAGCSSTANATMPEGMSEE